MNTYSSELTMAQCITDVDNKVYVYVCIYFFVYISIQYANQLLYMASVSMLCI